MADCTVEAVGCLQHSFSSAPALLCPASSSPAALAYLELLLGLDLLPEGLHTSCEAQKACGTLL